ncbi:hypothetical protein HDV05_003672 [Chytridiales sp. JEL 0842]|nr:hypothetical protein HDV05_003672 [Chytridiales sp. JEL 0842]
MSLATTSPVADQTKVVFITGATSGLGRTLAVSYAEHYSQKLKKPLVLVLTGRRVERLQEVKTEIEGKWTGVRVEYAKLDVTVPTQVFSVFNSFVQSLGHIDVCVANSGVADDMAAVGSLEAFEKQNVCVQTNIVGLMATVNAAMGHFKERRRGQLVGMGSVAAFRGAAQLSAYGASKAFVETYFEAVRNEIITQGYKDIIVTTIHPGFIDTEINREFEYRPFVIEGPKGGRLLMQSIESKTRWTFVPYFPWFILARLMAIIPGWIFRASWKRGLPKGQSIQGSKKSQ